MTETSLSARKALHTDITTSSCASQLKNHIKYPMHLDFALEVRPTGG